MPPSTREPFILTSVSPRPEAEKRQRDALTSWQKAGFRAVSLNFSGETGRIRTNYPQLDEVVEVRQGCTGGNDRSLAALADLIEISYKKNAGAFSLVFNADILFDPAMRDHLLQESGGVTMIPRWITASESRPCTGERDPWGFDGVRLGPELRGRFTNRSFGLGLPWWDYWIPFRALHLGFPLKILDQPLAFHVRHEEKWDEQDRARLAGEVWREVGVPPWKRLWRKHFGPRAERKNYGYHNHLAGHVREHIQKIGEVAFKLPTGNSAC